MIEIPADGGSLTEGIIGAPRFINPLLAISDADRDLTIPRTRVSCARPLWERLFPTFAQEYSISDDGLTYTFVLRDNIFFHDGTPITADDVVFTVTKAQDSVLKVRNAPIGTGSWWKKKAIRWLYSDSSKRMLLFENTTLGILPKHIWEKADPNNSVSVNLTSLLSDRDLIP